VPGDHRAGPAIVGSDVASQDAEVELTKLVVDGIG